MRRQSFKGLGEKVEDIERLISDDPDAVTLLDGLLKGKEGNPTGNNQHSGITNNVSNSSNMFPAKPKPTKRKAVQGNSRAYTVSRLERDRPDLFAKVCAKELTANAAAKLAGWRKEQSPLDAAKRAWKKMSADEQTEFLTWAASEG